jgi:hypothetical protein
VECAAEFADLSLAPRVIKDARRFDGEVNHRPSDPPLRVGVSMVTPNALITKALPSAVCECPPYPLAPIH